MTLPILHQQMCSALDAELLSCVLEHSSDIPALYNEMMLYQLGWDGKCFDIELTGKRVRPRLLLLTVNALGGDWKKAIPAAAALELIHNFSLVHDDIQDRSPTRRGRDTAWVKWGEAQSINMGDAMLTLANLEIMRLQRSYPDATVLAAATTLVQGTLWLTKGQFLDIAHEKAEDVTLQDYWKMVAGKTGALFSVSFVNGALLAGIPPNQIHDFSELGKKIGFAFQVQDDFLGIWGNSEETGKSSESDLAYRKKTFPVQFALENFPEIRSYWMQHPHFTQDEVERLKEDLTAKGVDEETLAVAKRSYAEAMLMLNRLFHQENQGERLTELITGLFNRMK